MHCYFDRFDRLLFPVLEGRARLRPGHCGRDTARPSQISPDATKRVPPDLRPSPFDLRLSTFDFPGFPMPQGGLPNLPGAATGRAAGLATREARFSVATVSPRNAFRASPAVSNVRRGSAYWECFRSRGRNSFVDSASFAAETMALIFVNNVDSRSTKNLEEPK